MNTATEQGQPTHWLVRLLYGTAAILCLLLGVVGLILPIIPGIVFLAIGGVLLSKASSSLAGPAIRRRRQPGGRSLLASRSLSMTDRLRLGGWVLARSAVNGIIALQRMVASKLAG